MAVGLPENIDALVRSIVREEMQGAGDRDAKTARIAYSPAEAAEAVKLPVRRIYNAINSGQLPALRNGRHLRIAEVELRRWLGERDAGAQRTAS